MPKHFCLTSSCEQCSEDMSAAGLVRGLQLNRKQCASQFQWTDCYTDVWPAHHICHGKVVLTGLAATQTVPAVDLPPCWNYHTLQDKNTNSSQTSQSHTYHRYPCTELNPRVVYYVSY